MSRQVVDLPNIRNCRFQYRLPIPNSNDFNHINYHLRPAHCILWSRSLMRTEKSKSPFPVSCNKDDTSWRTETTNQRFPRSKYCNIGSKTRRTVVASLAKLTLLWIQIWVFALGMYPSPFKNGNITGVSTNSSNSTSSGIRTGVFDGHMMNPNFSSFVEWSTTGLGITEYGNEGNETSISLLHQKRPQGPTNVASQFLPYFFLWKRLFQKALLRLR